MTYPARYLAKFSFVNGDFANAKDKAEFETIQNAAKSVGKRAYLRYNGPRAQSRRPRCLRQSMCLKRDATEGRVYIYNY
jgi:hypothetical protein